MEKLDYSKIEALAARRLTEQQIADVMNISLDQLKKDRNQISRFREAIRKGRAKGEAELRGALYKRARTGDIQAYSELLRREKQQGND
ncbi:hypothetical protein [Serratia aquatilis]|uniref:Uncharacterized protein n=1 Tax=Serratia aquatilis TaxID=1737515 RepID=A0ABV6EEI2_9GAMM